MNNDGVNNNFDNNYQQQPTYSASQPEPTSQKKKSKVGIVIAVILVLLLGILIFLFLPGSGKDRSGGNSKKGSNFIAPKEGETHKGIVYLDPTDLNKKCTEEDVKKNVNEYGTPTGIDSGCMKFYVYDDSGDNYKMILDHNVGGAVPESSAPKLTVNNAATQTLEMATEGWVGTPRLLTANEVAHIVGVDEKLQWEQTKPEGKTIGKESDRYFLDGSGTDYSGWSKAVANESNKSKYAWLYDYTNGCIKNGCNVEDNNKYKYNYNSDLMAAYGITERYVGGYWLARANESFLPSNWYVYYGGLVDHTRGLYNDYQNGIRPVIKLSKQEVVLK